MKPRTTTEAPAAAATPAELRPSYYKRDGIEVIEVLKAFLTPEEMRGFVKGSMLTYMLRAPYKGQEASDLLKTRTYAQWLDTTAAPAGAPK